MVKLRDYVIDGLLYAAGVGILTGIWANITGTVAIVQQLANLGVIGITLCSVGFFAVLSWLVSMIRKNVKQLR